MFGGFHAPKKPPSALAMVGDYLDTPFLLAGAVSRRHKGVQGYDPNPNWDEAGKVLHQLTPDKIDDVASRYNLTSPEQLADQEAQGSWLAGQLRRHPKVAMVDQFVSEFANPTNVVVPRVASIAGKAVNAGVKAIPGGTDAVQGAKRLFSPTGGLRQEGGVQSDRIGRKTTAMRNEADAEAVKRLDPVWENTTLAERHEIERRSELTPDGQHLNPPKPVDASVTASHAPGSSTTMTMRTGAKNLLGGTLTDAQIDARAKLYRAHLQQLDAEQLAAGTAKPEQLMGGESYTPRYGGGYKKVYDDPHSSPEVAEYLENTSGPGSGASYRSGTLNKRKQFLTYDQAAGSGLMSKDYDPANNALAHFRQRLGNIKINNAVGEFKTTGQLAPLEYRFGDRTGFGKEGYEDVMKGVDKHATMLAKLKASQETGLPIMRRAKTTGAFLARLQEANRNSKAMQVASRAAGPAAHKVAGAAYDALTQQQNDIEDAARKTLGRANATAAERAAAQRDLINVQTFRQRQAAEQRMGTRLPGGTVANTRTSGALGAAFGGGRRLTPGQKTIAAIDRPAERMRQGAQANVNATEEVGKLANDAFTAKVTRIGARTPRDVQRIAAPAAAVAKRMYSADKRAADRTTQLALRLAGARMTAEDATRFQKAFHDALEGHHGEPGIREGLKRSVVTDAERRARAQGRVTRIPQNLSSMPVLQHSSVTPALADYLQKMAAAPEDAGAIAHVIDSINKLARIGIISNPAVHVLWNLNNNFLGAGGKLTDLAQLYNPRYKIPQELMDEAEHYGAFVHFGKSTQGLGGLSYGKLKGASSDLNAAQRVDQAATKVWDANQTAVFDYAEKRIAATLYKTKKEWRLGQGMSEADAGAQAGIDVRQALGDYANVSRQGLEKTLNKALFFYPWLKTVIPFWVQTAVEAPQHVNAPFQAIRANNENAGDPNADKENPTAIYLGSDKAGNPRYFSWPGPQKILSSLAEMAAPQGNPLGGMSDRVTAASRLAESHMNPVLGDVVDTGLTAAEPSSPVGGANMTTMWEKDAPADVQAEQFAGQTVERTLPLPPAIKEFANFLGSLPGRPDPLGDMVGIGTSGLVGGNDYQRGAPATEKALYRLRNEMHRQVSAARAAGQEDVARNIYFQYNKMMQRVSKGAQ
jgi:hypothetical protein